MYLVTPSLLSRMCLRISHYFNTCTLHYTWTSSCTNYTFFFSISKFCNRTNSAAWDLQFVFNKELIIQSNLLFENLNQSQSEINLSLKTLPLLCSFMGFKLMTPGLKVQQSQTTRCSSDCTAFLLLMTNMPLSALYKTTCLRKSYRYH